VADASLRGTGDDSVGTGKDQFPSRSGSRAWGSFRRERLLPAGIPKFFKNCERGRTILNQRGPGVFSGVEILFFVNISGKAGPAKNEAKGLVPGIRSSDASYLGGKSREGGGLLLRRRKSKS